MDISLIVAAYNEEPVILANLKLMVQELCKRPGMKWELICVDDGSTDRTGSILDEFARSDDRVSVIHHRRNYGQGRALRSAFERCSGEVVVTVDADLSYGVEYIYRLADVIFEEDVEIALASAYMPGGQVRNIPFIRLALSRLGNYYLSALSDYSISTSTCVVRAYHKDVLTSIALLSDGMELQIEILAKAHMLGFRVKEIPAKLEWAEKPKQWQGTQVRRSKMNKSRSIRLYLALGWLHKPALVFMIIAAILSSFGLYLLFNNLVRYGLLFGENLNRGIAGALSASLRDLVVQYPHTVLFCMAFLLFGGLTFAFALLLMQNKYHYDELYKLCQLGITRARVKTRDDLEP